MKMTKNELRNKKKGSPEEYATINGGNVRLSPTIFCPAPDIDALA